MEVSADKTEIYVRPKHMFHATLHKMGMSIPFYEYHYST